MILDDLVARRDKLNRDPAVRELRQVETAIAAIEASTSETKPKAKAETKPKAKAKAKASGKPRGRPPGQGPTIERVRRVLLDGPMTLNDVAAAIGIKPNYLYRVLPARDEFAKLDDGRWTLVGDGGNGAS